jgi:hypothetical protein
MVVRSTELTHKEILMLVRNDDTVLGVENINNLHNEI